MSDSAPQCHFHEVFDSIHPLDVFHGQYQRAYNTPGTGFGTGSAHAEPASTSPTASNVKNRIPHVVLNFQPLANMFSFMTSKQPVQSTQMTAQPTSSKQMGTYAFRPTCKALTAAVPCSHPWFYPPNG